MTPLESAEKSTVILGQILGGNALGFFMLFAAVILLGLIVKRLWDRAEQQYQKCVDQHDECAKDNRALSHALIDILNDHRHEARVRVQSVLEKQGYTFPINGGSPPTDHATG